MTSFENLYRIEQLGEEYFRRRESEGLTVEQFVAQHVDHAQGLRDYIAALDVVQQIKPHTKKEQETKFPVINDYRIFREIGRGGMGVVYEAEQVSLSRRVALKTMKVGIQESDVCCRRFQHEARTAAKLHHSNIVPVYEVGEQDDTFYYAMQFIEGCGLDRVVVEARHILSSRGKISPPSLEKHLASSLVDQRAPTCASDDTLFNDNNDLNESVIHYYSEKHLNDNPKIAAKETIANARADQSTSPGTSGFRNYCHAIAKIGFQAADALQCAHSNGVIHRDIKPANLLMDHKGDIWVADFGLVKTENTQLTQTGDLVGTLRYMSPERFEGVCDARSDIYSLGLTLYEMLALQPAFDVSGKLSLLDKIQSTDPPRLRDIDPRIPYDLQTIISKSIDKEPSRRYQSAKLLADDLTRYLEGRPIHARRVSTFEKTVIWSRRNPIIAGLIATLTIILVGTAVASSYAAWKFRDLAIAQRSLTTKFQLEAKKSQRFSQESFRNFQAAQNIVDEFFTTVSESEFLLRNSAGSQNLRRSLLAKAKGYYSEFISQKPTDDLASSLSKAHHQLGKIQFLLGELDESRTSFQSAIDLLKEQTGSLNPVKEDFVELANVNLSMAKLKQKSKKSKQDHLNAATEILDLVEQQFPNIDTDDFWATNAALKTAVARRKLSGSRAAVALKLSQESIAIYDKLYERTQSQSFQVKKAHCQSLAGIAARRTGFDQLADEYYSNSIAIGRRLAAENPDSPEMQIGLAGLLTHYAIYHSAVDQHEKAYELSLESRDVCQALVDQNPSVPDYKVELAVRHTRLAGQLVDLDRIDDAIESGNRGIELRHEIVRQYPNDFEYQLDLAESTRKFGRVLHEANRYTDAIVAYEKSITVHDAIFKRFPQQGLVSSLARVHERMSYSYQALNELDDSFDSLAEGLTIRRALVASNPDSRSFRGRLAHALKDLGNLELKRSNLAAAESMFRECCEHVKELLDEQPDYEPHLELLVRCKSGLSQFYRADRDLELADTLAEEALDIFDSLSEFHRSREGLPELRERLEQRSLELKSELQID